MQRRVTHTHGTVCTMCMCTGNPTTEEESGRTHHNAGLWSRSRRLGLETVSIRINARLGLVSRKIVNVWVSGGRRLSLVSVSAIYVSCPRPIFGQIVQATERSVNGL